MSASIRQGFSSKVGKLRLKNICCSPCLPLQLHLLDASAFISLRSHVAIWLNMNRHTSFTINAWIGTDGGEVVGGGRATLGLSCTVKTCRLRHLFCVLLLRSLCFLSVRGLTGVNHMHVSPLSYTYFFLIWSTFTQAAYTSTTVQGGIVPHAHTQTHANTRPLTPVRTDWGQLLPLLCHFRFGSGPSDSMTSPFVVTPMCSVSPLQSTKGTPGAVRACRWVTERGRGYISVCFKT